MRNKVQQSSHRNNHSPCPTAQYVTSLPPLVKLDLELTSQGEQDGVSSSAGRIGGRHVPTEAPQMNGDLPNGLNHPKLTINNPVGLVPSVKQWFEGVEPQTGSIELIHPELMRNYPMIFVPSGAQWFEEVR